MKQKNLKQKKISLFGIIITVLSILFVFLLFTGFVRLKEEFHIYGLSNEESFSWDLESQDYTRILTKTCQNEALHAKSTPALEEYYALGRYYEAAFYYKLYETNGQGDKAARYKAIMEEKKEALGYLQSEISNIHKLLSIDDSIHI